MKMRQSLQRGLVIFWKVTGLKALQLTETGIGEKVQFTLWHPPEALAVQTPSIIYAQFMLKALKYLC